MGTRFWQKPIFWVICFVVLTALIPLLAYLFKPQILSGLSYITGKIQLSKIAEPGSCLILPQKYCLSGKIISHVIEGQTYTYIGFRLPPNVPIFSPEDLTLKKGITGGDPFLGSLASMTNPDDHTMASLTVYGDFLHLEGMIPSSKQVKQGEEFAKTQNTGVKMFKGDYNIVITAFRKNPSGQGFIIDEEILNKFLQSNK